MHYINKHFDYINDLLKPSSLKRKSDHFIPQVFGFESGILKFRTTVSDTQMEHVFDVMSREEVEKFNVYRALKSMDHLFSPAAEEYSKFNGMYS
jgi:hypothetical protein